MADEDLRKKMEEARARRAAKAAEMRARLEAAPSSTVTMPRPTTPAPTAPSALPSLVIAPPMPTPPPLLNRSPNRTIPAQEPLDWVGAYQRALKARTSRNLETGNAATADADAYREVNAIADLPMPAPPRPTSGLADIWDAMKPQGNVQDQTPWQKARGVFGAPLDIVAAIPELPRMLIHEAGYEPAVVDAMTMGPDLMRAWANPALNYADPMNLGNNAPPEARERAAAARSAIYQMGRAQMGGDPVDPALVARALNITRQEAETRLRLMGPLGAFKEGAWSRTPNRYPLEEQGTPEPPVMTFLRDGVGLVEGGVMEGASRFVRATQGPIGSYLTPEPNPDGYWHGVADRIRSGNAVRGDIKHLYGKGGRALLDGANFVASQARRIPGAETVMGPAPTEEERAAWADWAEQAAGAAGLAAGTLLEGKLLHASLKAPGKVAEVYGQHRAARTAAEANAAAQASASASARAGAGPAVGPPPPPAAPPPPVSPVRIPPPLLGGGPRLPPPAAAPPPVSPVRIPAPLRGGRPIRPPVDPADIIDLYPPPREFRTPTQMVNERRAQALHQPDQQPTARPPSLHQPDLEPAQLSGPWPPFSADPRWHTPDAMPGVPAPLPGPPRARWAEPPAGPGNVRLRGEAGPRTANPLLQGEMEESPTVISRRAMDENFMDLADPNAAPLSGTGRPVGRGIRASVVEDPQTGRRLVVKDTYESPFAEAAGGRLAQLLMGEDEARGTITDLGPGGHPVVAPYVLNVGTWGDVGYPKGQAGVQPRPFLPDMAPEDITAFQKDSLVRHMLLDGDANAGNFLVRYRPDGRPQVVPIDRGLTFHNMIMPDPHRQTLTQIKQAREMRVMERALGQEGGELLKPPSQNPALRQWIEQVQAIPDEQLRPVIEQEVRQFYEDLENNRATVQIGEHPHFNAGDLDTQVQVTVEEIMRRRSRMMEDAEEYFGDGNRRYYESLVGVNDWETEPAPLQPRPQPDAPVGQTQAPPYWQTDPVPWRPRIAMPERPPRDQTQYWAEGLDIRETPLTQQRNQVLHGPWPRLEEPRAMLPPAPRPAGQGPLPLLDAGVRGPQPRPRRQARFTGDAPTAPVDTLPKAKPFEVYRTTLTGDTKEAYYFDDPQGNVKGPFRTPNKAAGEARATRQAFLRTGEQTGWVEPGPPAPPKRGRSGGGRGGPKPPEALPSRPPVAETMEGPAAWEIFEREPGKFYWRAPDGSDIGSYIRLEDAGNARDLARLGDNAPVPERRVMSPEQRAAFEAEVARREAEYDRQEQEWEADREAAVVPEVPAPVRTPPPGADPPVSRPAFEPYESSVVDARGRPHKRYFYQTPDGTVHKFSERGKRDLSLERSRTAARESGSSPSPSDTPPAPGRKRRRDRRGALGWAGRAAPAASPLQALVRGQVPEYIDRMALEAGRVMDRGMDPNALPANVQSLLDSVSQEMYQRGFDELLVETGLPHRTGSMAVKAQPLPIPLGGGPRPVAMGPPPRDPMLPNTHPGRVVREAVRLASTQQLPESVLQSLAGGAKVHRRTAAEADRTVQGTLSVERQDALLRGRPVEVGDLPALQQHIPYASPVVGRRLPGNAVERAQLMREYQQAVLLDSIGEIANPRHQVQGRPGPMKQLLKSAADATTPGKRVRRPWVRALLENPVSRYAAQLFEDPVAALPDRTRHVFEQFRSRQEQLQNDYAEQVKAHMRTHKSSLEDAQLSVAQDWADRADLETVGRAWVNANLTARRIPPNKWADLLNPDDFRPSEARVIGLEYLQNQHPVALNAFLNQQKGFNRPLRDRQWSEANATMAMNMGTHRNVRAFADAMFEERGIVHPADRALVTRVFEGRHATVGPHGGIQYHLPREDIVRAERILRNMGLEPGAFDPAIPLERISIDADSVFVPEYQARAIENLKAAAGTQFSASRVPGIGGKVIDGYLRLWKSAATLTRPAYYLSQMVTAPYYVQLAEGVGTAAGATRNLLLSGRNSRVVSALMERADQMRLPRTALKPGEEYIRTKGGAVYHIDEFEAAARDQGLFEGRASLEQQVSLRRELVRHSRMYGSNLLRKAQATPGYVTDLAREFSNAFDTNMRVSTMVELAVNQGLDPVEAASRAKKATLDFRAHNSSVDKDARLLFTWWSYLRANHDMHMRALLTHPERVIVPAMAGLRGWQNLGAGAPAMAREAMGGDEARPLSDIEIAALSNQDLSRIPFYLDRNVTDWEGREDPRYAGWAVTTTPGMGIEWIGPFLAFKDAMAPAELADQRDFVGQFSPPIQVALAGVNPRSTAWANRVPEVMLSIPGFKERFGIDLYPLRPDDQPALADPSATEGLMGRDGFWAAGEATADPNARAIHQRDWQMFKAGFSPFITFLDTGATLAGVSPPPPYMTTNEYRATWAVGGTPRPIYHEAEVGYQNKAERVKNLNDAAEAAQLPKRR